MTSTVSTALEPDDLRRSNITTLLAKTSLPSRPALIAFARDHGLA